MRLKLRSLGTEPNQRIQDCKEGEDTVSWESQRCQSQILLFFCGKGGTETGAQKEQTQQSGSRWSGLSPERCLPAQCAARPGAVAGQTQEAQGNNTSRAQLWLRPSPSSTTGWAKEESSCRNPQKLKVTSTLFHTPYLPRHSR